MNRFLSLINILMIFVMLSCSTKPALERPMEAGDAGVLLETSETATRTLPSIETEVGEANQMGPFLPGAVIDSIPSQVDKKRTPVLGFILGPGFYRTFFHIAFLKALEKNNIVVHIVSGTEFGGVVAALYASGMTPEKIEWLFYKFFRELEDRKLKPYSKDWHKLVARLLLQPLENVQIESLQKMLILPVSNASENKMEYFKKGPLYEKLVTGITNIPKAIFRKPPLGSVADLVFGVDVLGGKIELLKPDDYLIGFWRTFAGISQKERGEPDLYFQLPLGDTPMDGVLDFSKISQKCFEYGEVSVIEIKKKIDAWAQAR